MCLVQERWAVTQAEDDTDLEAFATLINSRLAAESRIAMAKGFGWLCAGCAIAACLVGLGGALAFYGYSSILSVAPAAAEVAEAL
jgi:hypothetical protein